MVQKLGISLVNTMRHFSRSKTCSNIVYHPLLALNASITTAADDIPKYFFLFLFIVFFIYLFIFFFFFFSKKISLEISCESIHMKFQNLFSLKKKKERKKLECRLLSFFFSWRCKGSKRNDFYLSYTTVQFTPVIRG